MLLLTGRIVEDATITEIDGGKKVINFTIAHNDDYRGKEGQTVKRASFIRCAYWVKNANMLRYLVKGKYVEVFGHLYATAYINKEQQAVGQLNATVRLMALRGGGNTTATATEAEGIHESEPLEDLPF